MSIVLKSTLTKNVSFFRKWQLTSHLTTRLVPKLLPLLFFIAALVICNTTVQVLAESMSIPDALWLSLTTVTTVGYGDFSPSTFIGRASMVVLMYGPAISIFSFVAAFIVEQRMIKRDKKLHGFWNWDMLMDHIQIINTPNDDTDRFLLRLVSEMHASAELEGKTVQLLSRKYPEGLPSSLVDLKVLHRTGAAEDGEILADINLQYATHILILARDSSDSLSDSVTLDVLLRAREINQKAVIVVEAVSDHNRDRFLSMGATAVTRPMRAYPEMLIRALCDPGSEQVIEEMFDADGMAPKTITVNYDNVLWQDLVNACVSAGLGYVVGFCSGGKVETNPAFSSNVTCDGLVILSDLSKQEITEAIKLVNV